MIHVFLVMYCMVLINGVFASLMSLNCRESLSTRTKTCSKALLLREGSKDTVD